MTGKTNAGQAVMPSASAVLQPGPSLAALSSSSIAATPLKASAMAASSSMALPVYLRVRIPMAGLEAITTTVNVPSDMYLADVLDLICRKKFLGNAKDWALLLADKDIIVPLDRTVESLQGTHNLRLEKRSDVVGLIKERPKAGNLQNTNPNGTSFLTVSNRETRSSPLYYVSAASIFKRLSEPAQPKYVSASDVASGYKVRKIPLWTPGLVVLIFRIMVTQKFIVQRKTPMSLGRHERVLSIDGDYIHIMPSDKAKAAGRTASYHISHVTECKQNKRAPTSFKLVVWKDKDDKRYDFEAENSRQAGAFRCLLCVCNNDFNVSHVPQSRSSRTSVRWHMRTGPNWSGAGLLLAGPGLDGDGDDL
jgi:hypothetical protein